MFGVEVCLDEEPDGEDCREEVADGHAIPYAFDAENERQDGDAGKEEHDLALPIDWKNWQVMICAPTKGNIITDTRRANSDCGTSIGSAVNILTNTLGKPVPRMQPKVVTATPAMMP